MDNPEPQGLAHLIEEHFPSLKADSEAMPEGLQQNRHGIMVTPERLESERVEELELAEVAGRLHEIPLRTPERERLAELEAVVERSMEAVLEFGQALRAIRDERLYRATHRSFQAYLVERWDTSRSSGYKAIAVAEIVEAVPRAGQLKPSLVAELEPLPPAERQRLAERALAERWTRDDIRTRVRSARAERLEREEQARERKRAATADEREQTEYTRPAHLTPGVSIHRSANCPPGVRVSRMHQPWQAIGVDSFFALQQVERHLQAVSTGDLNAEERAELARALDACAQQLPALREALRSARRAMKDG